jgi:hypothetical protein
MVEKAPFKLVRKIGEIEIRHYPSMILASVYGLSDDASFRFLFNYIAGANQGKKEIPMTAPVINAPKGERIAMTAPVVSDSSSFSFVMPSDYTLETTPVPLDEHVVIEERRERTLAVLPFSGRHDIDTIGPKKEALLAQLKAAGVETVGEVFLMRYNAPFTPGFMRRNEVAVEIRS